jgi:hypothetical protein
MKIRSNIHAGDALSQCQQQRDYWKNKAYQMEQIASSSKPKPPIPPYYPPYYPPYNPPTPPIADGGYVGSVWYPDRSGSCG